MMEIRELWQELDDQQAEKLSGGDEIHCVAWSIGFSDVLGRPSTSNAPSSFPFHPGSRLSESSNVDKAEGKIRGTLLL